MLGVVLLVVVWGGLTVGLILFVCFVCFGLFVYGWLLGFGLMHLVGGFGFGLLLLIVFLFGLGLVTVVNLD